MSPKSRAQATHPEAHNGVLGRLNSLRAAVLGANDGVVSTAGLVLGVAGASESRNALLTAGLAGLLAGSLSMAVGEYVSVSTQRDAEQSALDTERAELAAYPEAELDELTGLYEAKGLPRALAREVAEELTRRDPLAAHADTELRIDPDELTNPWAASIASFFSFALGAVLPLLAIYLPPEAWRVPVTVVAVLIALFACGWASARMGESPTGRAVVRNVVGGALAMAITYGVGRLLHTSGTG